VADANTVGAYDPKTVSVKVGDSVQWVWQDSASQHTVTANDGSFDSGLCNQGATFSFTFSKAGTFNYHCTIHAAMLGTVTVS
jgi:plastocyanin